VAVRSLSKGNVTLIGQG